jgi:glycosyltransferase involved in cell wall biosynthesis
MSPNSRVSVIMPAFNAAKTIGAAVESVLAQTYRDWELLVVNDGSTDSTLDIMAQFRDERIRTITQVNQGVAAARNAGMKRASGAYIAFLDSDDLWLPTKLEKQVSAFELSGASLGLVYTRHRGFIEDVSRSFSMDVDASIGFADDWHRLLIMDYIPTLTVMMRASLVPEVGYFCEDLRGTEDWDYWIRIAKHSKLARVNEELALYRISPHSLSRNKERHSLEELKVLNQYLKAGSNVPGPVIHMAFLFWYIKKIRYQLAEWSLKKALTSLKDMVHLQPAYMRNYYWLTKWVISYLSVRIRLR